MSEQEIERALNAMHESTNRKANLLAELYDACDDEERDSLRSVYWKLFDSYANYGKVKG